MRNNEVSSVGRILTKQVIFSSIALNGDKVRILVLGFDVGTINKVVVFTELLLSHVTFRVILTSIFLARVTEQVKLTVEPA